MKKLMRLGDGLEGEPKIPLTGVVLPGIGVPPFLDVFMNMERGTVIEHGGLVLTHNVAHDIAELHGVEWPTNAELFPRLGFARQHSSQFGFDTRPFAPEGLIHLTVGLSVRDVSQQALANLWYAEVVNGKAPLYEWDTVTGRSVFLGVEVAKDGANKGSVQVHTFLHNQRGELLQSFVRQVLVAGSPGTKFSKMNTTVSAGSLSPANLQLPMGGRMTGLHPEEPRTWEDFEVGELLSTRVGRALTLAEFTYVMTQTHNCAIPHHDPDSRFLGYGPSVLAVVDRCTSPDLRCGVLLGMSSCDHHHPALPADTTEMLYGEGKEPDERTEFIFGEAEVLAKYEIPGRQDLGVLELRKRGYKSVTDVGKRALSEKGREAIVDGPDGPTLHILTSVQFYAVPRRAALVLQ